MCNVVTLTFKKQTSNKIATAVVKFLNSQLFLVQPFKLKERNQV